MATDNMSEARNKYQRLIDAVRNNKESKDLVDKLVKYSKPMTAKLNQGTPIQYGEGGEPEEYSGQFYPAIFENAQNRVYEERTDPHFRAKQDFRVKAYKEGK